MWKKKLEKLNVGEGLKGRIFNLRTILGRYLEVQRGVDECFIDYEKAFYWVYHNEFMKMFGND